MPLDCCVIVIKNKSLLREGLLLGVVESKKTTSRSSKNTKKKIKPGNAFRVYTVAEEHEGIDSIDWHMSMIHSSDWPTRSRSRVRGHNVEIPAPSKTAKGKQTEKKEHETQDTRSTRSISRRKPGTWFHSLLLYIRIYRYTAR